MTDSKEIFKKMKEMFDKLPSAKEIAIGNAYSQVYEIMNKRISEHDPDLKIDSPSKEFIDRGYDFKRCDQKRFEWIFIFKGENKICSIVIDWGWTRQWDSNLGHNMFEVISGDMGLNPIRVNDVTDHMKP